MGVGGFLAVVASSAAIGWRRSVAGLPFAQQLWEKTVRLSAWSGRAPAAGETPADFARDLEQRFRGVRDIEVLARAYNRSRFGRKDAADDREQLTRIWTHLRAPLI